MPVLSASSFRFSWTWMYNCIPKGFLKSEVFLTVIRAAYLKTLNESLLNYLCFHLKRISHTWYSLMSHFMVHDIWQLSKKTTLGSVAKNNADYIINACLMAPCVKKSLLEREKKIKNDYESGLPEVNSLFSFIGSWFLRKITHYLTILLYYTLQRFLFKINAENPEKNVSPFKK